LGGYREFWFLKDTFLSVDAVWNIWNWQIPAAILGPIYLIVKVVALLFLMIWVRAAWPRIRYDRLMSFGWKVLVPLSLAIVFITATGILLADMYGSLWMWTIPVASTLAGLVAVMFVFRALRRKAYERA
jgi:NADH:ubiquinone oxidoreductase subunit H